jgi:PST family polysaccharide transporter
MKDLKVRVLRGGFARLCGQAVTFALRLVFLVVMARLLSPDDFGLVAMVTVVIGIYELFSTAGLSAATVQRLTITDQQIATLFWINMLIGTVLGLLCLATAPVLAAFYHEPRLFWVTIALAAGFLFSAAGVQHFALLQRDLRYVTLTVIEVVAQLGSIAVGIGMAVDGLGYWGLVAASVSLRAIMTACMWLTTPWIPGKPRRTAEVNSLLRFGGTITLNNLVVHIGYNLEKVLLGRFWGADALGIYGGAYQLINVPTTNLNAAVGGVAFSALSRLQGDPVRLKSYFLKGYSLVNSMTIPTTVFCMLFADEIILVVLGPKWTEAATIFRLLAPTILVFGAINPTGWLLQSVGLQGRSLRIALVIAPLVITACVIGLPYGPTGVAFAFSAAMTLWLVPHIVWCVRDTVLSPSDLFLAMSRPFLASIAAAALAFGVVSCFGQSQSPILRLLVGGGVMAFLYLWTLLFVMRQRSFYFDLFRSLRGSPPADAISNQVLEAGMARSDCEFGRTMTARS